MDQWLETYRGTVFRWEVDNNDHLTVAYYFARIGDAALAFLHAVALGPAWVTVDAYVRYHRELRVGDIMHMESGVVDVNGDRLRLGHRLVNSETGELCTTVEQDLVPVAAAALGVAALTAQQQQAARTRQVAWDGPRRERRPRPATLDGFRDTARDSVKPSELDVTGRSALASHVHRFSAANAHATAAFGLTPGYMHDARRGFSTFEFQLAVEPVGPDGVPARAGDPLVVRSALLHVGTSSLRVLHVMSNARTKARVASLEQYGVHLDLDARRPAPLPDTLRARAQAILVTAG